MIAVVPALFTLSIVKQKYAHGIKLDGQYRQMNVATYMNVSKAHVGKIRPLINYQVMPSLEADDRSKI
jgi:hypothetical protein